MKRFMLLFLFLLEFYPLSTAEVQQLLQAPVAHSRRFELEESININNSKRAEIGKQLINNYLISPIENKARLRYWWERLGSRHALYNLAETYCAENESNRYEATLRNLNRDLAYSDQYIQENNDYIELYGIKSKILKSGRTLKELNPSEIERIRRIANNAHADAAIQANNILCVAIGECKKLEIPRLAINTEPTKRVIINSVPTNTNKSVNSFVAYPNPTHGSLTIDFDIQNEFTEGSISLLDLTGRTVLNHKINKGQKQVVWQTEQLKIGLYFIILTVDNQIVKQAKVSIQK